MSIRAKHYCPQTLAAELKKLGGDARIYVTHLKPGEIDQIMQEIEHDAGEFNPRMLQHGQIIDF